jgi:hypothetical protein
MIAGNTKQWVPIRAMSTGGAITGMRAADFDLWYARDGGPQVALDLVDLVGPNPEHAPGGIFERTNGWYCLALPDVACAVGASSIEVGGAVDAGEVLSGPIWLVEQELILDIIARLQRMASGTVAQTVPMLEAGNHLAVTQGETYRGERIRYASTDWPNLAGVPVQICGLYKDSGAQAFVSDCVVEQSGLGTQAIQITLSAALTRALLPGHRHIRWAVWAAYATEDRVLRSGDMSVLDDCRV